MEDFCGRGAVLFTLLSAILLAPMTWRDLRTKTVPAGWLYFSLACGAAAALGKLLAGCAGTADIAVSLLPGALLIIISGVTGRRIGEGDGLCFLFLGMMNGFWRTFSVLCAAWTASAVFSAGVLLSGKGGRNARIPFLPFVQAVLTVFALFDAFGTIT